MSRHRIAAVLSLLIVATAQTSSLKREPFLNLRRRATNAQPRANQVTSNFDLSKTEQSLGRDGTSQTNGRTPQESNSSSPEANDLTNTSSTIGPAMGVLSTTNSTMQTDPSSEPTEFSPFMSLPNATDHPATTTPQTVHMATSQKVDTFNQSTFHTTEPPNHEQTTENSSTRSTAVSPTDPLAPRTSPSATMATATDDPTICRDAAIIQRISNISGQESLSHKANTPQLHALEWILYSDPAKLQPDDDRLTRRYVLSTLFYALHGTAWTKNNGWLTEENECGWEGVFCSDGTTGNITSLQLGSNNMFGSIPEEIGYLGEIEGLFMDNNDLTDSLPTSLGQLMKLSEMSLQNNQLSSSIPASFGNLVSLQDLLLFGNLLDGPLPQTLGNLQNLVQLQLYNNAISGPIPAQVGQLTKLQRLWLSQNSLNGDIPSELGQMSSLKDLYLDGNYLDGQLPDALSRATQLTDIRINHNLLDGFVPDSFQSLTNLQILYINDNHFGGPIPTWIGSKSDTFEYIDLSANNFTGPLPEALGGLPYLRNLNVSSNLLSSTIPASLGKLMNLRQLELYGNNLTGTVASQICDLRPQLTDLVVDCTVECTCCTQPCILPNSIAVSPSGV